MSPVFTIKVDRDRSLVRICLAGFFNPSDIERFCEERFEAHKQRRCGPNEHLTLVDIRHIAIQSQDAAGQFQKAMHTPSFYSRKTAIVVSNSLSRSQIKLAAQGRDARYFEDIEEAELWLLDDVCER